MWVWDWTQDVRINVRYLHSLRCFALFVLLDEFVFSQGGAFDRYGLLSCYPSLNNCRHIIVDTLFVSNIQFDHNFPYCQTSHFLFLSVLHFDLCHCRPESKQYPQHRWKLTCLDNFFTKQICFNLTSFKFSGHDRMYPDSLKVTGMVYRLCSPLKPHELGLYCLSWSQISHLRGLH